MMIRTLVVIVVAIVFLGAVVVTLNTVSSDRVEKTQEDPAYTDTGGDDSTDTTDDTTIDDSDTTDNTGTDTDNGDTTSDNSDTDDSSSTTDESTDDSDLIPAVDKLGTWKQVITVEYVGGGSKDILSFLHENKEVKAIEYKLYIDLEDNLPADPSIVLTWTQIKVKMIGNSFSHISYFSPSYNQKISSSDGFVLLYSHRVPVSYFEDLQDIPYGDIHISMEMTKKPQYSFDDTGINNYYRLEKPNIIEMTVHHEKDYDTELQIIAEYEVYNYDQKLEQDCCWGQSFELDKTTKIHSVEYVIKRDADAPPNTNFNVYVVDTTNPSKEDPERGDNFVITNPPLRSEVVAVENIGTSSTWKEIKLDTPVTLEPGNYAVLIEETEDGYRLYTDIFGEGYNDEFSYTRIKGIHMLQGGISAQKFNGDVPFRIWGEIV